MHKAIKDCRSADIFTGEGQSYAEDVYVAVLSERA